MNNIEDLPEVNYDTFTLHLTREEVETILEDIYYCKCPEDPEREDVINKLEPLLEEKSK